MRNTSWHLQIEHNPLHPSALGPPPIYKSLNSCNVKKKRRKNGNGILQGQENDRNNGRYYAK